jgi:hypothetical protein
MSAIGYGELPMLFLALSGVIFSLHNEFGILISLVLSAWSSIAAGQFMHELIKEEFSSNRKALIVYPMFLFYVSFAMIAIF